jgi:glutamate---cysteine ligase / carboxylate-amine ligase
MVRPGDTIGVEEEFHVVRPDTGAPEPASRRILRGVGDAEPELQRSMIETASGVHTSLSELREDLIARRKSVAEAAGRHGLAVVAAATVPEAGRRATRVYPNDRYEWMAEEYRQLVDEQQVCACQVQVGVPDRDLAVRITRRIRAWLAPLLAMSVSSPLFAGLDTGYASYRSVVTSRWPTVGPSPDLNSAAEYDQLVADLVATGVISDAGMVYFDTRLSARYPTVEIRVADGCPTVDDAVLVAALGRALVDVAAQEDEAGTPVPESPQVLIRAATWRAARSGLSGLLLDPLTRQAHPAHEQVDRLFAHCRPALEARGDWATACELWNGLAARGTSADRQRTLLARGATHPELVRALIADTYAS